MAKNTPTDEPGSMTTESRPASTVAGMDKALEQFPEAEREHARTMLEMVVSYRKALSMIGVRADESAIVLLAAAHQLRPNQPAQPVNG